MKRNRLKQFALILLTLFLCTWIFPTTSNAASISKKKLNMAVGDTFQLKVKGTTKKVKWRSSKSSVVSVTSNGTLKAKKYGKAVITAKVGKQSYKCNAFVSKNIVNTYCIYDMEENTVTIDIKNNSCASLSFGELLGVKDGKGRWITPLALRNPSTHQFIDSFTIPAGKTKTIYFRRNPNFQGDDFIMYYARQLVLPFKCQNRNYAIIAKRDRDLLYTFKTNRTRIKIPTDKTIPLPPDPAPVEPEYATMDKYNQISIGMNYSQVRDIMKFEGSLLNSSTNAYASYQYYKWYGKEDYTAVYVYFRNGTVFTTSQYGL